MDKPSRTIEEVKEKATSLVEQYPDTSDAESVLRGLYRLYFDNKPKLDASTKGFLLGEAFRFSAASGTAYQDDRVIFDEEVSRYRE